MLNVIMFYTLLIMFSTISSTVILSFTYSEHGASPLKFHLYLIYLSGLSEFII